METLGGVHRGNFEAGGSVFIRIANGLGEIAHIGAELVRVVAEDMPKLFDPEVSILVRHQPRN